MYLINASVPPDTEHAVFTSTAHLLTIRTPVQCIYFVRVARKIEHQLLLFDVPYL